MTTATATVSKNLRTGFQFRYDTVQQFNDLKAELQSAIDQGIVSAKHSFVQWMLSADTQSKIDSLEPGLAATEEELLGLECFGDNASAVIEVLNANCLAKPVNRQVIAALIASVLPGYSTMTIQDQERAKASQLAWVDANSINEKELVTNPTSSRLLVSKKGPSGGARLRGALKA